MGQAPGEEDRGTVVGFAEDGAVDRELVRHPLRIDMPLSPLEVRDLVAEQIPRGRLDTSARPNESEKRATPRKLRPAGYDPSPIRI